MQTGISTASLFFRKTTEDALKYLNENNVPTAEVFLESYCEYDVEFGKLLKSVQGKTKVHSVHTLTTQFEPQLYSINERAKRDSFLLLDRAMCAAEQVGAKYYTFHGGARFKKTPFKIDYERVGKITQDIIDAIKPHGVTLAYENVHWGYYNYIGFFEEIKKRTNGLKATLDIKQARQSGIPYTDYINEMKGDIVTVHLSDIDENGKMCLPGKGVTDFEDLFKRLSDVGFDGALLIEAYQSDYGKEEELLQSLEYVQNLSKKIIR
ncbi:MAG: sugar phosphate isomerase/epimerase [Clostridia bacterium]|nr:sugar phosphate isomerase/epimerase [Clostridia bacterium]